MASSSASSLSSSSSPSTPAPPRAVVLCDACGAARAALRRPKTLERFCRACFIAAFEEEVHRTITEHKLFRRGERVALGASGGKDSTVLIHVLKTLNDRFDYGLQLHLLSIDEGIRGYRDDSLATVEKNSVEYQLPLKILSYEELYGGWTMDKVVSNVGLKSNCTFCGVFRRQALDRGAMAIKADKVATGHNADDIAETVVLNLVRGDFARLGRCTAIVTGSEGGDSSAITLPRCKPLKYAYEKEIVLYAYFNKLTYFSTECVYAPQATRGFAREFIKDLEAIRPKTILRLIESAETLRFAGNSNNSPASPSEHVCQNCGYLTSQKICKACVLLDGLNKGTPHAGLRKTSAK